jgi:hypothetical protein
MPALTLIESPRSADKAGGKHKPMPENHDMETARQIAEAHFPTSLDHSETFVQQLLVTTEAQERIHAQTSQVRASLIQAFVLSEDAKLRRRAERLSECCKWPLLFVDGNDRPHMSLQRCRDRLCPVCSKIKSRQTAARVEEIVQAMDAPRFVTLTVSNLGRNLKECTDHLVNSFRELRRSKLWKQQVDAGVWTIEAKQGSQENTWHVHMHMIIDSGFIDQSELSSAWLKVTHDSKIVDIRKVNSVKDAARYIAKYIGKPAQFDRFSQDEIVAYATAMKARRLLGTFGKLHNAKPEQTEEILYGSAELSSISVNKLRMLESAGFQPALDVCNLLQRCGGYWSAAIARESKKAVCPLTEDDFITLGRGIRTCAEEVKRLTLHNQLETRLSDGNVTPEPPAPQQDLIDDWLACPVYL